MQLACNITEYIIEATANDVNSYLMSKTDSSNNFSDFSGFLILTTGRAGHFRPSGLQCVLVGISQALMVTLSCGCAILRIAEISFRFIPENKKSRGQTSVKTVFCPHSVSALFPLWYILGFPSFRHHKETLHSLLRSAVPALHLLISCNRHRLPSCLT